MCGIAGVINFKQPINRETINKMLNVIVHRGPDDFGIYYDSYFSAGMRRLSIIDLTTGHQPIFNEDNTILTFFNGEIYNYLELISELKERGHTFRTKSDTEVLVHLYEEYGINFLNRLNGMFAFFLADLKKNEYYIVRDHVGIKPLYYTDQKSGFYFASELKSILQSAQVISEISPEAIFNYFNYLYIPSPRTIFDGIRKLEAGHYLKITPRGFEKFKWFDLSQFIETNNSKAESIAEEIRFLLEDSVRLQMRSDVPVGAFLSGGTDSSALVALATENTRLPINTFSVGFENSEFDELPYARQIARLFDTNHHELVVSPKDALDSLPDLSWFMDEPIGDSAVLPAYLVSKLAVKHVKVSLSGLGGDELFGGYERYQPTVSKFEHLSILPDFILKLLRPILELLKKSYGDEINKLLNPISSSEKYHLKISQMNLGMIEQLIGKKYPDFNYGKEIRSSFDSYQGEDISNQSMYTDIICYMNDQLLHLTDRASMAVSLETRVPFLDPRLIKLALSIPSNLKVNKKDTKLILKKALQNMLPDSILHRRKWGFASPHKTWVVGEMIQEFIEQTIEGQLVSNGILSKKGVATFLTDKEKINKYSTWVWPLVALEIWFSRFSKLIK